MASGELVAGGMFTNAGSQPASRVASWNGSSWQPLGSGVQYVSQLSLTNINTLLPMPDGRLFAGGLFTQAGGAIANRMAFWDGSNWSAMDSGVTGNANAEVRAVITMPNGDLAIGGWFTNVAGTAANNLAIYSAATHQWTSLGLLPSETVRALAVLPGGTLAVACTWSDPDRNRHLALWNGSAWSPAAHGLDCEVRTLTALSEGKVIAAGTAREGSSVAAGLTTIARWEFGDDLEGSWHALGAGLSARVNAILPLPGGDSICAGDFFVNAAGHRSVSAPMRPCGHSPPASGPATTSSSEEISRRSAA
jgi:hypothetical protein